MIAFFRTLATLPSSKFSRPPYCSALLAVAAGLFAASAAPAAIFSSDIVAWYGLYGDATDHGDNGFDGVNNGATFVADPDRGTVASFDGTSSSIDVSASGYSITESPNFQFSVSFWIKPTLRDDIKPGGATDVNVLMGGSTGGGVIEIVGDDSWQGMGGSSAYGSLGVNSGGGAGSAAAVDAIDVYDGQWHHVLMQWVDPDGSVAGGDAADATVFIDGTLADDKNGQTYNGNGGLAPTMVLGGPVVYSNGGGANKYYQGLMSDVIFFNRQLNPNEVSEAMALSASTPPIPEPSSIVLAALGLVGLAAFARRRRAKR